MACIASEESFAEATTRIGCRFDRDCEPDVWDSEGFSSVGECVDARFDEDNNTFLELCREYDTSGARTCLAALRKNQRQCGELYEERSIDGPCRDACEGGVIVTTHGVSIGVF